jgi:hypothetical protein
MQQYVPRVFHDQVGRLGEPARQRRPHRGPRTGSNDTMFADGPPRKLVAFFRGMILLSKVTRPFERMFAKKAKS